MESQLANTPLITKITKELYRINYLTSYPLSDKMLEDWSVCIYRLEPFITPEVLRELIDSMIIGSYDYIPSKGIQNIFNNFKIWVKVKRATDHDNKYLEIYKKYYPQGAGTIQQFY